MTIEQQQPPLERILLLDQNIAEEAFEDEREEEMVSPGLIEDQEDEELKQHQPSPDVSISPDNFDNRIVKITAICSAGCETILSDNREDSRQHLLADPSDAMDYNVEMTSNSSKITAVLFVGISVDERFSCGEVILLDLNSGFLCRFLIQKILKMDGLLLT